MSRRTVWSAAVGVAMLVAGSHAGCYGGRNVPEAPAAGKSSRPPQTATPAAGERDANKPAEPRVDAGKQSPELRDAAAAQPGEQPAPESPLAPLSVRPEANLRVAFIGDQSIGESASAVLALIARERAALVVHAGDLSYGTATPLGWEDQINDVLGPNFPYVVAAGNHDLDAWVGPNGFDAVLTRRLARTPELGCSGELGIKQLCRFRGLEIVVSAVGTVGTDHEWYLERTLARPGALIRLCVWHKNQHDMQAGDKANEVGWNAYKICARHGAPIITAHEHSYARTFTLTAIGDRARKHGRQGPADLITIGRDSTFVVVSGLGGHSSRAATFDRASDTWWASVYADNYQMMNTKRLGGDALVEPGALFIDFHVDGDPTRARAYFMTIGNRVVDRFELKFDPRMRDR